MHDSFLFAFRRVRFRGDDDADDEYEFPLLLNINISSVYSIFVIHFIHHRC